jgi:hypothetical protein
MIPPTVVGRETGESLREHSDVVIVNPHAVRCLDREAFSFPEALQDDSLANPIVCMGDDAERARDKR